MHKNHPEPKAWVPIDTTPLFDQKNGRLDFDGEVDDPSDQNMRRLIDAGIITTLATGTTLGGF